jgi:hypothetical protein
MTSTDLLRQQHSRAIAALGEVSRDVALYRATSDDALLEFARLCAEQQRLAGAAAAVIAGEIGRRSAVSLGGAGLAQRSGHRTVEELIRATTGQTARDSAASVRVGRLAQDAAGLGTTDPDTGLPVASVTPWLVEVAQSLVGGAMSVAAAESIRAGLGEPTDNVTPADLTAAARLLCHESLTLDADRLFRRARELRDTLDETGIGDREAERRNARSLRFIRLPNGMARLIWLMDPETAAHAGELFDRTTSPRRGGPRFVSGDDRDLADRITADTRTTEQLASDVFIELLRQGADADSSQLLGSGAPVVRMLVSAKSLDGRTGHGHIEGHPDPVSIETVERAACCGGVTPVSFDSEVQPLDVGREQRLFTRRQRIALAARDGGCRFPGCDRPPSWTEAHHIRHWGRDHGGTDVGEGILLCRHHHLLCHNNHWEIEHRGGDYSLVPPADIDPTRTPIPMPSRSTALRELMSEMARR